MVRSRKQSLVDEKAALQRRLKEIDAELELIKFGGKTHDRPEIMQQRVSLKIKSDSSSRKKPLRQIIIGMLSDVGYMLTNTTIRHLYEGRFQQGLAASRLGTLSIDEDKRKNKWNTTVYGLTHPIQLAENKIVPIKNIWSRSDWPINQRVYLPTTEKLIYLHFLDWYITASGSRQYKYLKSPIMLRYVEGVLSNLDLDSYIRPPYDSARAKKIVIQEITLTRELEKTKYSERAFKIIATHKQSKKHYNPEMYADTDMNI